MAPHCREGGVGMSASDQAVACVVDSHAHVYDLARYPFDGTRGFDVAPNEVGTVEQFLCVLDAHGFTHGLLANPLGGYGTDNRCLISALQKFKGRLKGVALVAHETEESDFARMSAAGIIGLRFNLNFSESPSLFDPGAERTLRVAREQAWFAQIHYEGDTILDAMLPLKRSRLPLVIDHCGRPNPEQGLGQAGFQALLELGREGAVVKLSGIFRYSREGFPYRDIDPYVAALIDAFTIDRCVWGSDWPFLRARHRVDHACLLQALRRWVPDAADRRKVFSDNPGRIFGFSRMQTYSSQSPGRPS
jgi:predicted TIM-barrel fold metal-dependent hydrolase